MLGKYAWRWGALALLLAAATAAPAGATTLIRMGLEDLVAANSTIVVGEVLDLTARWNYDGSFIVTDVRLATREVLKGGGSDVELTITLPGGTIAERTHLIVGSAELVKGRSYVLFLSEMNLLGAGQGLVVRDLMQGAFDIRMNKGGLRAVSQALQHPLVSDGSGQLQPPGGPEGMPIETMFSEIRRLAARPGVRREVK